MKKYLALFLITIMLPVCAMDFLVKKCLEEALYCDNMSSALNQNIALSKTTPINSTPSILDSLRNHCSTHSTQSKQATSPIRLGTLIDLDEAQSYFSSTGKVIDFDAPMKLYVEHGAKGDLGALESAEGQLKKDIADVKAPRKISFEHYKLSRRLSLLHKIKNHVATKALNTIQKASLDKSWETLCAMRKEIYGPDSAYGQPALQPVINISGPRITKYTVKNLQEAERSFHSRLDYKQMVKKQELEKQALEKAQQAEQQISNASTESKEVYLDSEQSQPLCVLEETNLSNDAHYDLVQTTPTDVDTRVLDVFHERVTVDPKTDFKSYIQQLNETLDHLESQGVITGRTAALFTKEFCEGTVQLITHAALHPVEYTQELVQSNIELVKQLGLLFIDIYSHPEELSVNPQQMEQYESMVKARVESVAQMYNHVCETIPQMSRKDWAKFSSRIFANYIIFKGIGKGVNFAKNAKIPTIIKENPLLGKLHTSLEQALAKHPELVTTEGLAIEAPQVALGETSILKHNTQEILSGKDVIKALQEETSAVKHNFKYHTRIRARALQDPIAHNFPYTFDDIILKSRPMTQNDGSLLFRHSGSLNGKEGFFEIALNKETGTIFHRTFIGKK